eukprot:363444-Pyramimonas_sp.AAC.1
MLLPSRLEPRGAKRPRTVRQIPVLSVPRRIPAVTTRKALGREGTGKGVQRHVDPLSLCSPCSLIFSSVE